MLLALLSPVLASAAEIVVSPSAEAKRYSWVVVDSRKLKVPLGVALAQLPGGECVGFTDLMPVACNRMQLTGAYGYNSVGSMGMPVPMITDDRGRLREAKVDGLKVKRWINWNPATGDRLLEVAFNQPTTEFGFDFLPTLDGQPDFQITYGFVVIVNGRDLGDYRVAPQGPFYAGMFYVR